MAHVADALASLMGFEVAENCDIAEAGPEQAGEDTQQRGFARAVFAKENVAAARLEIDCDLAQGGKGAEELGDVVEAGTEGRAFRIGSWNRSCAISLRQPGRRRLASR